jgi:hypothetical protein
MLQGQAQFVFEGDCLEMCVHKSSTRWLTDLVPAVELHS